MRTGKRYRLLLRTAVCFAAAAFLAPSAGAVLPDGDGVSYGGPTGGIVRPDDRSDLRGPGSAPMTDTRVVVGVVRPDDRPDPRGPGSAPVTDGLGRRLDPAVVRDEGTRARPGVGEPRSTPPIVRMDGSRNPGAVAPQAPVAIVVQPTGFDWRDAGVGIAIGAALVLALAAGMLVIGRRRDPLARV